MENRDYEDDELEKLEDDRQTARVEKECAEDRLDILRLKREALENAIRNSPDPLDPKIDIYCKAWTENKHETELFSNFLFQTKTRIGRLEDKISAQRSKRARE